MKKIAAVITAVATVLCALLLCSCGSGKRQYSRSFIGAFDTQTVILGYEKSEKDFEKQAEEIYEHLEEYHRLFDIYNEYEGINNLKTVNKSAGIAPVKVDARIIDLLKFSKEICELTGGKTSIAMGSVLSIWHDYRERGLDDPDSAALPPMEKLENPPPHRTVQKESRQTASLRRKLMQIRYSKKK